MTQEKDELPMVAEPLKEQTTTNAPDVPHVDPVQGPKKYKTVPEGKNTGKFSEDEVAQLREGLELYGRDWGQVGLARLWCIMKSHCNRLLNMSIQGMNRRFDLTFKSFLLNCTVMDSHYLQRFSSLGLATLCLEKS